MEEHPRRNIFSGLEHPRRKKPFRFEEMWLSNTSCEEVVKAAWYCTRGTEDGREVLNKVEKCGKDLNWWNRNVFGNVRRELEKAKKMLIKAEREAILSGNNFQVRHWKAEIEVLLEREAIMWQQRSRLLWAREGDRNTKYFHSCATRRHRKNLIESIRDDEGVWRVQQEEIGAVLVDYYKSLFASTDRSVTSSVLECVPPMITDEMNEVLCCKFEESEVTKALNQMAPLKAPGPDGMDEMIGWHHRLNGHEFE